MPRQHRVDFVEDGFILHRLSVVKFDVLPHVGEAEGFSENEVALAGHAPAFQSIATVAVVGSENLNQEVVQRALGDEVHGKKSAPVVEKCHLK